MRQPPKMLLATGDPLLNQRFEGISGAVPLAVDCETPNECLECAQAEGGAWILLSRAVAPLPGSLAALVRELGERHPGMERLVLVGPDQLDPEELHELRNTGARLIALPEEPVTSLRALLRTEITGPPTGAQHPATPVKDAPSRPAPFTGGSPESPATPTGPAIVGQTVSETGGLGTAYPYTVLLETGGTTADVRHQPPVPTVALHHAHTAHAAGARGHSTDPIIWSPAEQPKPPGGQQWQAPWQPQQQGGQWPGWQSSQRQAAAAVPPQEAPVRAGEPPPAEGKTVLRQRVVALWGGKPGTGRSTLLVAVSDLIARMPGVRVCSVDLNPVNSSLAPLLRKEAEPNSWWRLGEALLEGGLTPQAVRESLITVRPGWSLLSGPGGSDQWCALLTARVVAELVSLLRADFDYILLDLPASRGPVVDAAFAHAQQILLTVSAFFPDVVDTARQFQQLVADGLAARERCSLVLSPWVDSPELPAADVGACMGLPIAATVPLAPGPAMAAARAGRPITQLGTAEAQKYGEAAAAVAALITGRNLSRPRRRSWFGH